MSSQPGPPERQRQSPRLHITRPDDQPWQEVKAQLHGDRRVSVWERYVDWTPDRLVLWARYDRGMVVERHGHRSDHFVFVVEGEITVGDERLGPGSHITLEEGAVFGPIVAGADGALLIELMLGDPRSTPVDPAGFAEWCRSVGITPLPNPPIEAPEFFADRTDSDPGSAQSP